MVNQMQDEVDQRSLTKVVSISFSSNRATLEKAHQPAWVVSLNQTIRG
jgi:hypothetical protein